MPHRLDRAVVECDFRSRRPRPRGTRHGQRKQPTRSAGPGSRVAVHAAVRSHSGPSGVTQALLGKGTQATKLFSLLNPINHTSTRADVQRYKVEPYVVAADVYSVAPHVGRGGWTWYTGSRGRV